MPSHDLTRLSLVSEALDRNRLFATAETVRDVAENLRELLRRDWAVRVLDAWQWVTYGREVWTDRHAGDPELEATMRLNDEFGRDSEFTGSSLDAARHAAAQAVLSTLSDAKRAELGECP